MYGDLCLLRYIPVYSQVWIGLCVLRYEHVYFFQVGTLFFRKVCICIYVLQDEDVLVFSGMEMFLFSGIDLYLYSQVWLCTCILRYGHVFVFLCVNMSVYSQVWTC